MSAEYGTPHREGRESDRKGERGREVMRVGGAKGETERKASGAGLMNS